MRMNYLHILTLPLLLFFAGIVSAQKSEMVTYQDGEKVLEGYLALPEKTEKSGPGVIIVHQWTGLSEHEKGSADMLAKAGYVAFACDIYGKETRPEGRSDAGEFAGKYKNDIPLFRSRLKAAFDTLGARPEVDPDRIAVIGYCFGGTGALELARSGADVKAVVSFHGGLSNPNPEDAKNIKGTVLVCHGAQDSAVDDEVLLGFMNEMRETDVDWYLMVFADAVHGFTHRNQPERYDEKADERSWDEMMDLFEKKLK